MLLVLVGAVPGCIDGNDWETDGSHSRAFSPSSKSISVDYPSDYTTVTLSWKSIAGTDHYVIELALDTLYDGVAVGAARGSRLVGEDGSVKKTEEVLIDGLEQDTRYFLRIKGVTTTGESLWSYLPKRSFTTKFNNLLLPVDKTHNSCTVTWDPVKVTPTRVVLLQGEDVQSASEVSATIIDADVAGAGKLKIGDLEGSTNYIAMLYAGDKLAGRQSFTTKAPPAGGVVTLELEGTEITSDYLVEAQVANGNAIIIQLPAGDVNSPDMLTVPDGLNLTLKGQDDGSTTMGLKEFVIAGQHNEITVENIAFHTNYTSYEKDDAGAYILDDGGNRKAVESPTTGYFLNQKLACSVGTLTLKGCTFADYSTTFFRTQGQEVEAFDDIVIEDCLIVRSGSGYGILHFAGNNQSVKNVTLRNVTVADCPSPKGLVFCERVGFQGKITLEGLTMNNSLGSGRLLIDLYEKDDKSELSAAGGIELKNCILGKTNDAAKGIRTGSEVTFENVYALSDCAQTANQADFDHWLVGDDYACPKIEGTKTYDYSNATGTSEKVFAHPVLGEGEGIGDYDFSINAGTPVPTSGVGDKRWWK